VFATRIVKVIRDTALPTSRATRAMYPTAAALPQPTVNLRGDPAVGRQWPGGRLGDHTLGHFPGLSRVPVWSWVRDDVRRHGQGLAGQGRSHPLPPTVTYGQTPGTAAGCAPLTLAIEDTALSMSG
jgi:hypothetical protein